MKLNSKTATLIIGLAAGVPIGAAIPTSSEPATPRVIETRPREVVKIPPDATEAEALALMHKAKTAGALVYDYRPEKRIPSSKPKAGGDVKTPPAK